MNENVWSVSGLTNYLSSRISMDPYLKGIFVEGEISNITFSRSGHWYFTIKDANAILSCVMFASYAAQTKFLPKTGDKILAFGDITVYGMKGGWQLRTVKISPSGLGELYYQLEQLKERLSREGLFNDDHKIQQFPAYPEQVAVICGKDSAAESDIRRTFSRRWPLTRLTWFYSAVEGKAAAEQLVTRIHEADQSGSDIILIARGGGSLEALWCFNDERVLRAVYDCKTPVISGVGHEKDVTLIDLVADKRASTPTAAVELITPDYHEVFSSLEEYRQRMIRSTRRKYEQESVKLDLVSGRIHHYLENIQNQRIHLAGQKQRLISAAKAVRIYYEQTIYQYSAKLKQSAQTEVHIGSVLCLNARHELLSWAKLYPGQTREKLTNLTEKLYRNAQKADQTRKDQLTRLSLKLDAESPLKILAHGYGRLTKSDGTTVRSIADVHVHEPLNIRVQDGIIETTVQSTKEIDDGREKNI